MMRACVVEQTQQRCGAWWHAVWAKRGSNRRLWEGMSAWCDDSALESRRQRLAALVYGLKQSTP